MEKRIRIIWILSLASALLLIGVQGYWLYNQYLYVTDSYLQGVSEEVLKAGDEEFKIRKSKTKGQYTFIIDKSTQYTEDDKAGSRSRNVRFSFSKSDYPADTSGLYMDSIQNINNISEVLSHDPHLLRLSFDADLPDKDLQEGIDRAVTNLNNAFRTEVLDSILSSDLPDIQFTITPWAEKDTLYYTSRWEKTGNIFHPQILVSYAYSPLEKKGVFIYADIPSQPLLKKMAVQLVIAIGLIFLLIGCLAFQIRTIMKQKKLSELRESFVNTMIHELKRPVQTLKTFISFLGDKEMRSDEAATEQVVQDSMFELDNLSAYLNKLKDMVRADNEQTPLHPSKFNLQELTEKVIRLINIPSQKEVKLSAEYEMESPWIEADPVHIANILSNLIENAVKYSEEQVEIKVTAKQKGRELRLTVTDNGIGIPFAEQEKVFAKFYRATNIPDRNIPGIGLGLSYVKLITEAHHGNISLSSRSGEGTTVTLYIPQ